MLSGLRRLGANVLGLDARHFLRVALHVQAVPVENPATDHEERDHRRERRHPNLARLLAFVGEHHHHGVFADAGLGRHGSRRRFHACHGGDSRRRHRAGLCHIRGSHHPGARLHVGGTRLHVERELRAALAELDGILWKQFSLAVDLLAVYERAVAALEIFDRKFWSVTSCHAQHGVPAADHVILRRVENDCGSGFAAERDFGRTAEREGIDTIDLGARNVANNDLCVGRTCHGVPP